MLRVFPPTVDLQHPLLLKYGFDETEFAIAVRDAYPIIIKALMSPDFHDFVHRYRVQHMHLETN